MSLSDLFPGLMPWARSLGDIWPGPMIKSTIGAFQILQSIHLIALSALGGCVILMGLRLAGYGMTSVSLPSMEKSTRYLVWGSIAVIAITGVVMGMLLAPRLYVRPAFLAKIIALIPALIMSFGVIAVIARNNGAMTKLAKINAAIALVIWLFAVWVFGWSQGSAPGAFHIILAGWLVVMGLGSGRSRIILGAITAVIVLGVGYVTYGIYHPLDDYDIVMEINRWTLRLFALLIAGFILWEFAGPRTVEPGDDVKGATAPPAARLMGLFTILTWVTVAAAGRWIGLGGAVG
jgi:hypothetical protein